MPARGARRCISSITSSTICVTFPVITVFGSPVTISNLPRAFCTPIAMVPSTPHTSTIDAFDALIGVAIKPVTRNETSSIA